LAPETDLTWFGDDVCSQVLASENGPLRIFGGMTTLEINRHIVKNTPYASWYAKVLQP